MKYKIPNLKFQISNSKGFTLIEILIVIALIGVLATLLMANFIGVRERGRDAQRKSNLRQIQSALELYRSDNSAYPPTPPGLKNCLTGTALGNTLCATIYMKKVPSDPLGTTAYNSGNYFYEVINNGYNLVACLENANDKGDDVSPPATFPTNAPTTGCSSGKYYVLNDL